MGEFVGKLECSLDVPKACREQGISLAELQRLRDVDPAFDRAMMSIDDSLERAIIAQIRAKAATGDVRATSLYLRRRPELLALVNGSEVLHELDEPTASLVILVGLHPDLKPKILAAAEAIVAEAGQETDVRSGAFDEAQRKQNRPESRTQGDLQAGLSDRR